LALAEQNITVIGLYPIKDLMEWTPNAEVRLKEIPFFVRPAARKKIEKFAQAANALQITVEIYEQAKQQFGAKD
jgi:hypothetical protein